MLALSARIPSGAGPLLVAQDGRQLDHAALCGAGLTTEAAEAMGMGPALIHRWQELSTRVAVQQKPTARLTVSMATTTKVLRQLVLAAGLAAAGVSAQAGANLGSRSLALAAPADAQQAHHAHHLGRRCGPWRAGADRGGSGRADPARRSGPGR